ncbi:MAG: NAD(P)-dependent oxidoreductase [Coriobacteriia bacterium]|nr:NAD(P)-dependent oxidoreductase [Coriobacteriia bacterium]
MTEPLSIAILGATGHVGKCLAAGLSTDPTMELTLVARDMVRLGGFVAMLPDGLARQVHTQTTFDDFATGAYDAVINCVGFGDPAALAAASSESVFALTERFDQLVLDYLARSPETKYVSFSSGAAYGGGFEEPASESTCSVFPVNALTPQDFYGLAKLASEAKHRAVSDRAIIDLRLFGLYSRYIDPKARYFMNDVFRAVVTGETLVVGAGNIWRDYVDPGDLAALLVTVLRSSPRNDVFDVFSAEPASKYAILDDFAQLYGLSYEIDEGRADGSPTGAKLSYYSVNRRAAEIGYVPQRTSLETLRSETDARLPHQKRALT